MDELRLLATRSDWPVGFGVVIGSVFGNHYSWGSQATAIHRSFNGTAAYGVLTTNPWQLSDISVTDSAAEDARTRWWSGRESVPLAALRGCLLRALAILYFQWVVRRGRQPAAFDRQLRVAGVQALASGD